MKRKTKSAGNVLADVDRIASIWAEQGFGAAAIAFNATVMREKLVLCESIMLRDKIQKRYEEMTK